MEAVINQRIPFFARWGIVFIISLIGVIFTAIAFVKFDHSFTVNAKILNVNTRAGVSILKISPGENSIDNSLIGKHILVYKKELASNNMLTEGEIVKTNKDVFENFTLVIKCENNNDLIPYIRENPVVIKIILKENTVFNILFGHKSKH